MEAVDTHCHLYLIERDPEEVVREAASAGVTRVICVGIDPETSRRSLELAERLPGVFATAGMHPHTASEFDSTAGSAIEELLGDPLVVGVGETGLDRFRLLSPFEDQERNFRTHIRLSVETGKPLVVHVRDAWEDAMRLLDEEGAERVVIHCFTGDLGVAREARARGYVLSFAGNVTYRGSAGIREAAASVDAGGFVVETDSPFLPPQRVRGTANAPSNLPMTLEAIAAERGEAVADVAAATVATAAEVFALPS